MSHSTSGNPPPVSPVELSANIKTEAHRLGFDLVGIAPAVRPTGFEHLVQWLERGYAGEMHYIPRRETAYEHPGSVLDGVRSLILLGSNYHTGPASEPPANHGRVARYARSQTDYHDLLRDRLQQLGRFVKQQSPGCRTRGVVDTAPLLERDFARLAGLGWFGKNTLLINRQVGSWLFLSALLVDLELTYDAPHETSHCGTCTRCLDACPTDAFPEPYVLDARRCISYLTIELRNQIPVELRPGMEDWVFGCDICQDVCPWNRKAPRTTDPAWQPLSDLTHLDLPPLFDLTDESFTRRFSGTPLERSGRAGLLRNAAMVLGNRGDASVLPVLERGLADPSELVRDACTWAIQQITARS